MWISVAWMVGLVIAQEGATSAPSATEVPVPSAASGVEPTASAVVAPEPTPKKSKGKRIREKEAEGTQAPNRFEANTVIKSQYELNGQPLEVDPD